MNVLKRTFVLSVKAGAQWEEIDGTNEIVASLFQKYRDIILVLGDDTSTDERIVDLAQVKPSYALFNNTLTILVQSLSSYGFETLPALPMSDVGYVTYVSAHWARYAINFAKAGVEYLQGTPVDMLTDVSLRRDDVEGKDTLHKYCLFSVNGYIHNSEMANGITYVKDAGKSMQYTQSNQMGILSFLDVGALSKLPITASMISVMPGFSSLSERIKLTVPEEYIGKPCFLVMGGYLIFADGLGFTQVSNLSYSLDMTSVHYVNKVLESQQYLDLTALGLLPTGNNPTAFSLDDLKSDDVITKYLTLSQSFLVFVDTDRLFWGRIPLRQSNSPGLFTTYQEPTYPLFLESGRMCDYWKQEERGRWSVTMADSYRRPWMHQHENEANLKHLFGQLSFDAKNQFSQGFLLEIGSYKNGSM